MQEAVSGIRLVKSFRGEAYEDARFTRGEPPLLARAWCAITRLALLAQPITEIDRHRRSPCSILWIGAREVLGAAARWTARRSSRS